MSFLERITRKTPVTRPHSDTVETQDTAARSTNPPARRYKDSGIPPITDPNLPLGRAAILIACTRTRRAYWIVFRHAPNSDHGWVWERNLPALPDKTNGTRVSTVSTISATSTADTQLPVGGRNWGDWSCPGCGQQQLAAGNGKYIHLQPCRCGTECCLGPGADDDSEPRCPNCRKQIRIGEGINRALPRHASQSPDAATGIPTTDRRQIEDG